MYTLAIGLGIWLVLLWCRVQCHDGLHPTNFLTPTCTSFSWNRCFQSLNQFLSWWEVTRGGLSRSSLKYSSLWCDYALCGRGSSGIPWIWAILSYKYTVLTQPDTVSAMRLRLRLVMTICWQETHNPKIPARISVEFGTIRVRVRVYINIPNGFDRDVKKLSANCWWWTDLYTKRSTTVSTVVVLLS